LTPGLLVAGACMGAPREHASSSSRALLPAPLRSLLAAAQRACVRVCSPAASPPTLSPHWLPRPRSGSHGNASLVSLFPIHRTSYFFSETLSFPLPVVPSPLCSLSQSFPWVSARTRVPPPLTPFWSTLLSLQMKVRGSVWHPESRRVGVWPRRRPSQEGVPEGRVFFGVEVVMPVF
jgi:hypothetical protein